MVLKGGRIVNFFRRFANRKFDICTLVFPGISVAPDLEHPVIPSKTFYFLNINVKKDGNVFE